MSRLLFSLNMFTPLIIGLTVLNVSALGQEGPSPTRQCYEERAFGRPKLKRRQLNPDDSNTPSVSSRKTAERGNCGHPDPSQHVKNELNVKFEGLQAITAADMLKLFREHLVGLPKDHPPVPDVLTKALTVLKEFLEARGYLQAVDARQDEENKTIVFLVSEGPRFSIGEIRFEGNRIFSSQELATRMGEFLHEYSKNGYDAEIFDVCLRRLTNFVRSRGYLQAKLGEPKREFTEGRLVVTVSIEEGALYRLGEIKIEGAMNFTQEQVRAMLSLQREDIANGEAIGKWLFEDLRKLYGEMGYIQYTAEPEPEFRAIDHALNEGVVDFKVTIEEGRQFRIRLIKVEGSNVSEKELCNLLIIRAGDVFNQQFFEKSVNQLNEMGWFELIDKDKDTDFRTDEEEGLLDITFRLKRVGTLRRLSFGSR